MRDPVSDGAQRVLLLAGEDRDKRLAAVAASGLGHDRPLSRRGMRSGPSACAQAAGGCEWGAESCGGGRIRMRHPPPPRHRPLAKRTSHGRHRCHQGR